VFTTFSEDPVRHHNVSLGLPVVFTDFFVCQETNELMKTMARNGEVGLLLVAERVWKELSRALSHSQPDRFFNTLNQCHALQSLFPQINEKSLINLQHAALFSCDPIIRFSSLCGNLSQKSLQSLISTYKIPKQFSDIALLHVRFGTQYKTLTASPQNILSFLKSIDAFRRPERLPVFCQSIELQKNSNLQTLLNTCIIQIKNISTDALQEQNLKGKEFANALRELQLDAINDILP
jgi:tRNA nucleotidyltransferase/poly(A) polymerase